ncbi:hypothetical protein SCALM49S_06078 [Streptomyces californicus]
MRTSRFRSSAFSAEPSGSARSSIEQGPGPGAVVRIVVPVLAHLARPLCLRLLLHRGVGALGPLRSVLRMRPGLLLRDARRAHRPGPESLVPHRTVPVSVAHAGPGPAPRCL